MIASDLADVMDRVTDLCRRVDDTDLTADDGRLLDSAVALDAEAAGLIVRLRRVLAGGSPCDTAPDLHGQCMRCGVRLAAPVADHKPGCNPLALVASRVRRLCVRVARMARALLSELRGRRS